MEQLLHTPEGVRDIYHEECAKKLALHPLPKHFYFFKTHVIKQVFCTVIDKKKGNSILFFKIPHKVHLVFMDIV